MKDKFGLSNKMSIFLKACDSIARAATIETKTIHQLRQKRKVKSSTY